VFRRKKEGAIVCPRCGKLVDVRASSCPSCGMIRPGFWGFGPALMGVKNAPFRELIVGFCTILYAGSLFLYRPEPTGDVSPFDLLSPTPGALLALGATGRLTVFFFGRWETLVTAVFLHGSALHIFFNCMWIWQLGPALRDLYDGARFFLIFLVSGIVGNLASIYLDGGVILIGSSGGVYGLFGALVWYGFRRKGVFGSRVLQFGLVWAGVGILISRAIPCVALWAHVGGFATGFSAGALLGYEEKRGSGPWVGVFTLLGGLLVLSAFLYFVGFPPRELKEFLNS